MNTPVETVPKITIRRGEPCGLCHSMTFLNGPRFLCENPGCERGSEAGARLGHSYRLEVATVQSAMLTAAIERLIERLDRPPAPAVPVPATPAAPSWGVPVVRPKAHEDIAEPWQPLGEHAVAPGTDAPMKWQRFYRHGRSEALPNGTGFSDGRAAWVYAVATGWMWGIWCGGILSESGTFPTSELATVAADHRLRALGVRLRSKGDREP